MNGAIESIQESVGPAMLVIMRIGGLAIFAPVLSTSTVPMRVKVLLVFVMGLAAFATLSAKGVAMPVVS
ncbi:MAG: flagellar biosynthetic protein FliR, partial [Planctomycetota bacterium]